jgi:hypothetical protein
MAIIHPWSIKAYAGWDHPTAVPMAMILHTWHDTEVSKDIEVEVFRGRMAKGQISKIEILDHVNAQTETIWT